jgi:hypothetical protein
MYSRGASAADIYTRIRLRGDSSGSWFAMIAHGGARSMSLRDFCKEYRNLAGTPARIIDCEDGRIEEIVESLHNPDKDTAILAGMGKWNRAEWEMLDINRSGLERRGPLILWLSEKASGELFTYAPNIRSYLAASLFHLTSDDSEMSDAERETRLRELRERFQVSDDQVIQMAEQRSLPTIPSFSEWLVLLRRGDLL